MPELSEYGRESFESGGVLEQGQLNCNSGIAKYPCVKC